MFNTPDNVDDSKIIKSLKDYFNKLEQTSKSDELSDDDYFFVIYYFIELSKAIIKDFGDDFSKRLASIILDTLN